VNQDDEVFGACAAAAMYRKSCFDEVGGFDEDYFCHFEDVDLSFRLRLAGYHCMHVADAVVHHVGSATAGGEESDFAVYHGYRNFVWTFIKCMPDRLILQNLPSHLLMNVRHVINFMKMGRGKVILKAKWHALIGLPPILSKRKSIQALSRVKQNELTRWMGKCVV
jgi:GT2 family glycosyltransferase